MNSLEPSLMTTPERLTELCWLLALGVTRLRARQSSHLLQTAGESSLHLAADQSGDATPKQRRSA